VCEKSNKRRVGQRDISNHNTIRVFTQIEVPVSKTKTHEIYSKHVRQDA